ncbi:TIGR04222 domain-containing membrane protein [Streptomyces sp. NPDC056453]
MRICTLRFILEPLLGNFLILILLTSFLAVLFFTDSGFTEETQLKDTGMLVYLLLHVALLFAAVVIRVLTHYALRPRKSVQSPYSLNQYDISMLLGGPKRVVETAFACLAHAGTVTLHPGVTPEIRPERDARPPKDAVQRQILHLLPHHPNGIRLASAFAHTEVAAGLRHKLVSAGLRTPERRRYVIGERFTQAVFFLALLITFQRQWVHYLTHGGEILPFLFLDVLLTVLAMLAFMRRFPVTKTGREIKLTHDISTVLKLRENDESLIWHEYVHSASLQDLRDRPEPPAVPPPSWDEQVRRVTATMSVRAEEWSIESAWLSSPTVMVPLHGWKGYRDRQRKPVGLRFWSAVPGNKGRIQKPDNAKWTPKQHRRQAHLHQFGATACAVIAVASPLVLCFRQSVEQILYGPLFLICGFVGARLATQAKKHRVAALPYQPNIARRPDAPHPLYLRSFAADSRLERPAPRQQIKTALLGSRASYIEELAHVAHGFGQLVAIGDPRDSLPGLGPAQYLVLPDPDRDRSPDRLERWQSDVLRFMDNAPLVVIAAGRGRGLLWEFRQATSRLPPRRLVVLVSLNRKEYAGFRDEAGALFHHGLPRDTREHDEHGLVDHALIYFDADWTPHFVAFARHPMLQLYRGRLAFRLSVRRYRNQLAHALYPVFRVHQVRWPGFEMSVPFGLADRHLLIHGTSLGRFGVYFGLTGVLIAFLVSWLT